MSMRGITQHLSTPVSNDGVACYRAQGVVVSLSPGGGGEQTLFSGLALPPKQAYPTPLGLAT